jgi:outer membrane receptor protein involved in Fe transport
LSGTLLMTSNLRSINFVRSAHKLPRLVRSALIVFGLASLLSAVEPDGTKKHYDIPASTALEAIKAFSEQSGADVLYSAADLAAIKTNPVKGDFTASEALDRLIAGTPLIATWDSITGGFAIKRTAADNLSPNSARMGAGASESDSEPGSGEYEQGKTPIVLSPFDVNASTDVGYGASATASTSRVVQNYVDVPQTVNVVTSEFLNDYNIQDSISALEYTPNITFGLSDNPWALLVRGAAMGFTWVDGIIIPSSYFGMPMDFFDRIEVVKGPSSAAFGLGVPGGLVNYVSKTPQGLNNTTVEVGVGGNNNLLFKFDVQRVDSQNSKLSYRLVGFWDNGGYAYPKEYHSGAGAQLSLRYDFNSTTRLDVITAYSQTVTPATQQEGNIWKNPYLYYWNLAQNQTYPYYDYLPGTKFSNGSVFGVSGTLPPPGTLPIFGTGQLLGADANPNPTGWAGWNDSGFRASVILTKSLFDGHVQIRNALMFYSDYQTWYDESASALYSLPGSGNTPITTGYPTFAMNGTTYNPSVGPPQLFLAFARIHGTTWGTNRTDDFDAVINFHLVGADWTTLIGADFYDDVLNFSNYDIPDLNADGSAAVGLLYSNSNPTLYTGPAAEPVATGWANYNARTWGDGFYAQEDVSYKLGAAGALDLLAGWRIDYYNTETLNFVGASTYPGWVSTKGAPRFAITYKPLKWLSVYELYTVHKDPSNTINKYFLYGGTEYSPALEAKFPSGLIESYQPGGYTVESGLKASFLGGKLDASVAVWHEELTGQTVGVVVANVINPDGTQSTIAENDIEGLNAHGVEAEIFGQLLPRLSFTANYGIERGNYPPFSNGVPETLDPSATISAHGKYDFGNLRGAGFFATFGGEWFGPYMLDQTSGTIRDVFYNQSQELFDGGIGFRWKTGKYRQQVYFNMDNFMNAIVTIGSTQPGMIEPQRSFFLTYKISY